MIFDIPLAKEILEAEEKIRPYIKRTPVLYSDYFNKTLGIEVYFKCENLQKIGAFKARGAINAVLNLTEKQRANGICTHSSGNHAQAIALAAKITKSKAYIVMPKNAPEIKKQGVKQLGGHIIECEPTLEAREQGVTDLIEKQGMVFIHPFNNKEVITGQASVAKELLEEQPELNSILTPLGGGGLLCGTALSSFYFGRNVLVYGCEPEGAADAVLSFKSGKVESAPYINTIADGLLTKLSENTLGIIKKHCKGIFTVSDEEIVEAMKLVFTHLKLVVEPSAVVAFASLIKNKEHFKGQKVGIVLTGGNIDLAKAISLLKNTSTNL